MWRGGGGVGGGWPGSVGLPADGLAHRGTRTGPTQQRSAINMNSCAAGIGCGHRARRCAFAYGCQLQVEALVDLPIAATHGQASTILQDAEVSQLESGVMPRARKLPRPCL